MSGFDSPQHRQSLMQHLFEQILPTNRFYAQKFANQQINRWEAIPFTTKAELAADQQAHAPYGTNHTFAADQYRRIHQTSGTTTGQPLRWRDTAESWNWCLNCWDAVYQQAGVQPSDRLFFTFSFGPFLGFWTAFEAATRAGFPVYPGGGMSSSARLKTILELQPTVLCCTPTYARHLCELAATEGVDLVSSSIRLLIVAGEPGGNLATTRSYLAEHWGARVIDHYGLTEVGPVAVEPWENPGEMHVLGQHYLAEIIDPDTLEPVEIGQNGELVLTNLGRIGSPVIRYRTGDLVTHGGYSQGNLRLLGGIIGRADDMIHLRGNNIYPAAIEAIVREFEDVAEYRLLFEERDSLAELRLEVEQQPQSARKNLPQEVQQRLRERLLLRIDVHGVPYGTLPRFEHKAKRFVRLK